MRENRTAFGPFTDADWLKFGRDSLRRISDEEWGLDYDPGLAQARADGDTDTWDQWEKIACPVVEIWGLDSKLLTAETIQRMKTTGPKAEVYEVTGAGHCPGLTDDRQIGVIREFLAR